MTDQGREQTDLHPPCPTCGTIDGHHSLDGCAVPPPCPQTPGHYPNSWGICSMHCLPKQVPPSMLEPIEFDDQPDPAKGREQAAEPWEQMTGSTQDECDRHYEAEGREPSPDGICTSLHPTLLVRCILKDSPHLTGKAGGPVHLFSTAWEDRDDASATAGSDQ